MTKRIVILPGDGIGPEVTAAMRDVLDAAAARFDLALDVAEMPFGGAASDTCGDPLPDSTLKACLNSDAVFLGAVGGPRWDEAAVRPEQGLLRLRQKMEVYANLRPIRMLPGLEAASPIKAERVRGTDLLIVRELTGGLYFGEREETPDAASDMCRYSRSEIARVARIAFAAARQRRGRVTSVDKANVLATSRLWRQVVEVVQREEFADIALDHQLVDSMAMKLITEPGGFDVVLTENLFGDILSDEASVLAGSIGLSPSASLGAGPPSLYEPIHGSAPQIAGQDIANPIGAILSMAMMLRHSVEEYAAADAVEQAVHGAIQNGLRTFDLGGNAGCAEAGRTIAAALPL